MKFPAMAGPGWAVYEFAAEVHAVRFDTAPTEWPKDHVASKECPCRPFVYWDSDAAPKPLYEHRELQ